MRPEELHQLAEEAYNTRQAIPHRIQVCQGTGCLALRSEQITKALQETVKERGQEKTCQITGVGCMGLCAAGPLVALEPQSTLYQHVAADDAPAIIDHLDAAPLEHLLCPTDTPFFQRQQKIVLENCGRIDPEHIEDYIAADGYRALLQAITEMTPIGVIAQVTRSGLRGRGGAGYPTGLKWTTVDKAQGSPKYVVCNADEGDPGAYMDRSVLEGDPHRVIEAMAIAAYAVGASEGYIYVRGEYALAIKRLRKAINQAERHGLLGTRIFGTPFNFHLEVRVGGGAFVCGEETALLASIEGKRGMPRSRPPYPAEYGLWGCPTLVNNVETLANIPPIIRNGSDWFAAIGTKKSRGTKVFSLTGRIRNTGLIEVPMGITLRDIVFAIGGGMPESRECKAIQTGGPSGGCIPASKLDILVDYESLAESGTIMGSGGMLVIGTGSSIVDVAKYFMDFCKIESCGECVPCRVGTVQMYDLLVKIADGQATMRDLALLEELCDMVRHTSLCGLGQSAPTPVLSTLRYFRDEYLELIQDAPPAQPQEQQEETA
jgi:bidirectional [NiFe] hydrogenase diaphorase subunit